MRGAAAPPSYDGGWHTLRAEHEVRIDAAKQGGGREQRTLRGVIAVQRPDLFRLRGLGPAGITVFDIVYRRGVVTVVSALRDAAPDAPLGLLVASMAGDLAAAYGLAASTAAAASTERRVSTDGASVAIEEPTRSVRLLAFQRLQQRVAPTRIVIDNRPLDYHVVVEVKSVSLDEPLDPDLFPPAPSPSP